VGNLVPKPEVFVVGGASFGLTGQIGQMPSAFCGLVAVPHFLAVLFVIREIIALILCHHAPTIL